MKESGPRQPSNLDPIDRDTLATLGYRIERWDILKDASRTFQERKDTLVKDLETEIDNWGGKLDDSDDEREQELIEIQMGELMEDEESLVALENTQEAFDTFANERAAYYIEVRNEFLKRL